MQPVERASGRCRRRRRRYRALVAIGAVLTIFSAVAIASQQDSAEALAAAEEAAIRAAAARVADSVVQIRTIGGLEEVDRTLLPDGPTTGLVVSPDGWIVSSAFNFVHQPASILVSFPTGDQAPATLVAQDHSRKLVLLKAHGMTDLAVSELAPAAEFRVGQWAIAVGRTFRADRTNISVGIVSALGRMFGKVIQTDADVSAANYGGPLIDIRGRVLGVIVPIAPQTNSAVAGAEWYDSGIGFAVPLASVQEALERMKQGTDQHAGVLGVSFSAKNPHASPAVIAAVMPNSPAGKAGFRKGDRIVEIDGHSIRTQTDLRFVLGTRYAGEEVNVVVARGDDQLARKLALVGELEPFRHAFLGILPMREALHSDEAAGGDADAELADSDAPEAGISDEEIARIPDDVAEVEAADGVTVRMVFPSSPAAMAGIRAGDRIVMIDDTKVDTVQAAIDSMNNVSPAAEVKLQLLREGQVLDVAATAARLSANVPSELPPAHASLAPAAPERALDLQELKLAEFSQSAQVYVPPSLQPGRAAGALLWLHAPGEPPGEEFFRRWKAICDRDGLLLVAPSAADPSRWDRTELEYLRRLIERVLAQYRVDRRRVVVHGQDGGGAMAFLLALLSRDIFTGIAATDAALPRTVQVPANEPTTRLAVFAGVTNDAGRAAQIQLGLKKFTDAGYPVTVTRLMDPAGRLSDSEREELARWIDSLDRF